jgi:rubrerythrin
MKNFNDLSEREVLASAISLEEEDECVYTDFAEGLRQNSPSSASLFDSMRTEESGHRRRLMELFRQKFGEHIPLIRRQGVKGFVQRTPVWLVRSLGLDTVRKQASATTWKNRRFYERAAVRAEDAGIRQLLDDFA